MMWWIWLGLFAISVAGMIFLITQMRDNGKDGD